MSQISVLMAGSDIKQLGLNSADFNNYIKNSYLELRFYTDKEGGYYKRFLPFLGDVTISESRKANYINYNPISRNTQIPFYVGSDSRIFKVTYEIALDYLRKSDVSGAVNDLVTGSKRNDVNTAATDKDLFLKNPALPPNNPTQDPYSSQFRKVGIPPENKDNLLVLFVDYQINLIRSTVINNSVRPTYGPPLVRLNHGILYQNIPCICTEYNVEQQYQDSNKKSYGVTSKLSNYKTTITFTLQEVRNGNFLLTPFEINNSVAQDNIVGWEQIIEGGNGSLDPITPIYKQ